MKTDVNAHLDYEPIHIGKIIEEELRRQERTVTWLSRKIHCDRRNIYDIFSRTCVDTDLLMRLSIALHTDFFAYFSASLNRINNHLFPPPHRLCNRQTIKLHLHYTGYIPKQALNGFISNI